MRAERTVAVVMPARNEIKTLGDGKFLERVLSEIPSGHTPRIYLSISNAPESFVNMVHDIAKQDDRIIPINLGSPDPRGLAYAYLYGLRQAVSDGAENIIEMDANGAHDPEYIPEFVDRLKRHSAVFSSRFAQGGGIEKYPFQRRMISRAGTFAANLVLGLGQHVDDMTSGYEAFRKDVLGDVFKAAPIENWISVTRGPGHFFQTEMRTLVIWRGHEFNMLPIVWGSDRMENPVKLPLRTVLKAFGSLMILRGRKNNIVFSNK